jgi:hypothetical protein
MKYKNIFIIILLIILICLFDTNSEYFESDITTLLNPYDIPVVVICWNNLTFIKNFVNQLKKYKNPIILLDNNSTYEPLLNYYNEIKQELKDKITINLLDENYGHTVYLKLKHILPKIFILSDPDLELNINMPENFAEIFLNISNKYKSYKVGSALSIEDHNDFIDCPNYTNNQSIYDWESQFWTKAIQCDNHELYEANIDTTFCLVNNNYYRNNIRIAGNFTAKHLPWYKDYIKNNFETSEIEHWKKNNKSSSILFTCLQL